MTMLRPIAHPADDGAAAHAAQRRVLEERAMFERYRITRDPHTRGTLVERFLPLARSLARRYEHRGEPLEDLVQVASLALVKAIDRFEPRRGYAFTSFAVPTIAGEIKRYFRDRTWTVRPPRELLELTLRIERVASQLAQQFDRAPTVAELGRAADCSTEQVVAALQAQNGRHALSLQAPHGDAEVGPAIEDELGRTDDGYERAEARAVLEGLMALLPVRDREVLRLRFQEDLTQAEIAALLGVSQMQVSRIIRGGIGRLREIVDGQGRLAARARGRPCDYAGASAET